MNDTYRCKDRGGVVHLARTSSWPREETPPVDETLCGECNYMERTAQPVPCVTCLAEEGAEG